MRAVPRAQGLTAFGPVGIAGTAWRVTLGGKRQYESGQAPTGFREIVFPLLHRRKDGVPAKSWARQSAKVWNATGTDLGS